MLTQDQATVCAWCYPPDEETPEETSHGICPDHRDWMIATYQLNHTPSYVEQNTAEFACEQEAGAA
jgi:hypothetical protein